MSNFIAPTGYVELDNDCEYSIDLKSTRSRESIDPKEDLAFYFNTYISPKYGLGNINVSNVASFMKDLDMNWSKLTPELKDKVMDIMVDGILNNPNGNNDFKAKLSAKIGMVPPSSPAPTQVSPVPTPSEVKSTFGKSNFGSKSNFGTREYIGIGIGVAVGIILVLLFIYFKQPTFGSKFSRFTK